MACEKTSFPVYMISASCCNDKCEYHVESVSYFKSATSCYCLFHVYNQTVTKFLTQNVGTLVSHNCYEVSFSKVIVLPPIAPNRAFSLSSVSTAHLPSFRRKATSLTYARDNALNLSQILKGKAEDLTKKKDTISSLLKIAYDLFR